MVEGFAGVPVDGVGAAPVGRFAVGWAMAGPEVAVFGFAGGELTGDVVECGGGLFFCSIGGVTLRSVGSVVVPPPQSGASIMAVDSPPPSSIASDEVAF